MIRSFAALSAGISAALIAAAPAHSDANSYLAYLANHGTFAGGQAKALNAGFYACDALHAGQTPDQILSGVHFTMMDVRGVIDAAQHELCPDTLH
jgi:hypothetical protein